MLLTTSRGIPISIDHLMPPFAGSKDLLAADTRRLRAMAAEQSVDLLYYEYPDMVHAWMFLPLPESKQALQQITGLICS